MDVISFQKAKKAIKLVGNVDTLKTNQKVDTVTAINELVDKLGLLIPEPPPNLSTKTIAIGTLCLLSSGVPNNSELSLPSFGSNILATRNNKPVSSLVSTFGSGTSGILSVKLNGAVKGSKDMSEENPVGIFGDLDISSVTDYPVDTPGFYKAISARYRPQSAVPNGFSQLKMSHSETGEISVNFVYDDYSQNPLASLLSVEEHLAQIVKVSGIPHYSSGAQLKISALLNNIISKVYGSEVARITGNGISNVNLSISQVGIVTPIEGEAGIIEHNVTLNQNFVGLAIFSVQARHPLATTHTISSTEKVLVRIGSAGVNEGLRVSTANAQYPNENPTVPSYPSSSDSAPHEAKIVGGVLKNDKTDYTTYLPQGPDYSNHNDEQYACFVLPLTSKTNARITVNGSYTFCQIKLPGITGWLDTAGNYPGAGNPNANGDPCRTSGTNTDFYVTFGTQSTAQCGNVIVLRFKLTGGQSISAFSVT